MRLLKGLIYSNFFVAFLLALLTWSSYPLINTIDVHWYVPVSVFLGSFVLYTFHRLYKIDFIPRDQLAERHHWVLDRAVAMKYAMSFAVFLLLLVLPNFHPDTVVWLIPAAIISVGYTIPIIPSKRGWKRFRDIPLTKPLIISLVVSYLTLAYPLFEQHGITSLFRPGFVQLFGERVLFLLLVTIPFDMRDIINDRDAGISTLGTHMGFQKAKWVGYALIACWVISMVIRFYYSGFQWSFVLFPMGVLVWVVAAYAFLEHSWDELTYILVFEGAILLYALMTFSASSFHTTPWSHPW